MLDIGACLRWYKLPEVQNAILQGAEHREVAARYGDGFGRRPDTLAYPRDVLEFAKNGATSFHVSEEHWENPQILSAKLSQKQLDALRTGWDMVLDIDCPIWKFSKRITHQTVQILTGLGIKSVSVKFSGNKGFHIGVPFQAFPPKFRGIPLPLLFPEAPRRIAQYISNRLDRTIAESLSESEKAEIAIFLNKSAQEVFVKRCSSCGANLVNEDIANFICQTCGKSIAAKKETPYMICLNCKKIMNKTQIAAPKACPKCGSKAKPSEGFNLSELLKVDTVLLASRHLFRMVYSLHEKSGLASIPVELSRIEAFEKEEADTAWVVVSDKLVFLDSRTVVPGEAGILLIEAYDATAKQLEEKKPRSQRDFELPKTPVASELFPPCINIILGGLEDGRKRAMFILLNFLSNMGWSYDEIEKFMMDWNERNKPPMKEGLLVSHLSNFKRSGPAKLPPNCDKDGYYKSMGVCQPDLLCKRIKNPANYYRVKEGNKVKRSRKNE